jgi:tRNA modification GTPase
LTADATTFVACLTPPGNGAIATLGLRGPRAWPAVRAVFRTRAGAQPPLNITEERFWLGRAGGQVGDEVVLAVNKAEPLPWIEIHCHGGREAINFLIDVLCEQGLTPCSWEAFLTKSESDPLRAAAAVALGRAVTVRTASILLDQCHGALGHALDAITKNLDHGESERALLQLTLLLDQARLGLHLTQPWRVVVAGAPNVGKSSLINALAGYTRSVVAPTPGTTRDVVTVRVALDGWPVELSDTAGLRADAAPLEAVGIERARATLSDADLCLWVLEAAMTPVWPEALAPPVHLVINKTDLASAWDLDQAAGAARVSARTGEGIPELGAALARGLVPTPPAPGDAVPFTSALVEGIREAGELLRQSEVERARRVLVELRMR